MALQDKPWITDRWHVSSYNFVPEVRDNIQLANNIMISDCTLRDGEQQPGVIFTRENKIRLAKALDELGIPELEVGMPSVSESEQDAVKAISKAGLKAKIRVVSMATKADIDLAVKCGADVAVVSLPSGYLQIEKLKMSEDKILETSVNMTNYAHQQGLYVVFSPMDTTRSRPEFLERYLRAVVAGGHVDRVRLTDTTGATSPLGIKYLVKEMAEITHKPIEVHCHNDFGLATANVLAGLEAGGTVASTAFNGLGERAGNAATEEVALALRILYNVDLGLKLEAFYKTSLLVQELSGVTMQKHKAVVGETALCQEAGAVVAGWIKNPFTAEPYLPEVVGQKTNVVIGKWSGKASVAWKMEQRGLKGNEEQVAEITNRVKEEAEKIRSALTEEMFVRICKQVMG